MDENASIAETSTTPTVEELIKKIEKLNSELSMLKAKDKKGKKNGFASDDDDCSYEEEASNKAKRDKKKCDKSSNNTMCLVTITYLALWLTPLCPLVKLLILMEQTIINESIA
jgi:hypothetical protein